MPSRRTWSVYWTGFGGPVSARRKPSASSTIDMPALFDTLGTALRSLDVAVHCSNPDCWRSGGTLDPDAFVARYGAGTPSSVIRERLRCSRCGWPGIISLMNAVNKLDERLPPPGPRIQPPPARAPVAGASVE